MKKVLKFDGFVKDIEEAALSDIALDLSIDNLGAQLRNLRV